MDSRMLQANSSGNSSGDNSSVVDAAGNSSGVTPVTETAEDEVTTCPPCITTSFTTNFAFTAGEDLSRLDLSRLGENLKVAENWGDDVEVVVTATFSSAFSLTFGPLTFSPDMCMTAVAAAFSVAGDTVSCVPAEAAATAAGAATAGNGTNATAGDSTNSSRRLQDNYVVDISIVSSDGAGAQQIATLAASPATMTAVADGFGSDMDAPVASAVVTTASVTFTVLSNEDLDNIDASTLVAQMNQLGFTVTASDPVKDVLESNSCSTFECPATQSQIATADTTIGSDAETCCVAAVSTPGGAQSTSALGSLTFLAVSYNFIF